VAESLIGSSLEYSHLLKPNKMLVKTTMAGSLSVASFMTAIQVNTLIDNIERKPSEANETQRKNEPELILTRL